MADIKNYLKEKEKRQPDKKEKSEYELKWERHRNVKKHRIFLLMVVIALIFIIVMSQYSDHVYTGYDVTDSVERIQGEGSTNLRLGKNILTYSKDGANCINVKGDPAWNQTFEMQDFKWDICGETVAVGEYNGRKIYVADKDKIISEITTMLPIRDICVAENGTVTAVLADRDKTWINTYDASGENIYSGQTHMYNSGYPVALSLSPDGEMLVVSYVYVDAGAVKTNVAFYNFGPVGKNQSDYIVAVYTYTDLLVPMIHYMNESTSFAVGDSRLMIYSGTQKPENKGEFLFEDEVKSVFYNDKYIGLVFYSEKENSKYQMKVYKYDATYVGAFDFDIDYTDLFFQGDQFVAYNESECLIMTLSGKEKYNGPFDRSVRLMVPVNNTYKYALVTNNSIDTIQFK